MVEIQWRKTYSGSTVLIQCNASDVFYQGSSIPLYVGADREPNSVKHPCPFFDALTCDDENIQIITDWKKVGAHSCGGAIHWCRQKTQEQSRPVIQTGPFIRISASIFSRAFLLGMMKLQPLGKVHTMSSPSLANDDKSAIIAMINTRGKEPSPSRSMSRHCRVGKHDRRTTHIRYTP
jgi:hypothetical protein